MMETPVIKVGIMSAPAISFVLQGGYKDQKGLDFSGGRWNASLKAGNILLECNGQTRLIENGTLLSPQTPFENKFTLTDVVIGINFHWERKENQVFGGGLQLLIEGDKITAINILSVEEYLTSVISSEMSATSSVELLKAHAVISRSWLLAQIEKNKALTSAKTGYKTFFQDDKELVRWWDREDHANFDVCADDHCQRYQGITRASTPMVQRAVKETSGEVLTFGGAICDARFSKCCGGVSEVFENVWEPVNHPYLQKVVDDSTPPAGFSLDLANEEAAAKWVLGNPPAFCNSSDKKVLSQILNDYDQETNDFFRWKVTYTQQQLSELIKERTGIDFGTVQDLIPLERGVSSRIMKLKIVGDKKSLIIGKELQIRKALSKSHLYSSAFVVNKKQINGELQFELTGAGWGHGVGLCQIGAAVMADKGYKYSEILMHYFRGAELNRRY